VITRRLSAAVVVLVLAALSLVPTSPAHAADNHFVESVNVGPTYLSVAWFTFSQTSSESVEIGTTCAGVGNAVGEQTGGDGFVHLSQPLGGLAPNSVYYVAFLQGSVLDNNGGSCWQVSTVGNGAGPGSESLVGSIYTPITGCNIPASGALIVASVPGAAAPVALLEGGGHFSVPIGHALTSAGNDAVTSGAQINATGYLSSADSAGSSAQYPGNGALPAMCLNALVLQTTPTLTPTVTPTASPVSTGFVTSTPLATYTPSITPTPSVTPTITNTPTVTPTPTATASPTFIPFPTSTAPAITVLPPPPPPASATPTATTVPTPTDTATPTATSPPPALRGWTRISPKSVHADGKAHVEVHTLAHVSVSLVATYPDKLSKHTARGVTDTTGVWGNTWTVISLKKGTVSVHLKLSANGKKKTLYRHFVVK
jgi:hypothetical protein